MKETKIIYQRVIIYYFSGTGNAKNAALWIYHQAERLGIESIIMNIEECGRIEVPESKKTTLIGFCSPTHGFNLPPIVLNFIGRFPKLKNTDAFILNTRAGMKLSKIFLPGISGLAQLCPALLLKIKGFNIVGMQPLDLPSNWILVHPGLKKEVVLSIYQRCHKIVNLFAIDLLHGNKKYKALWSLPFDILLLPIAIAYYLLGRFFLAKTLIATLACHQCGTCVRNCPVQAISMKGRLPFWSFKCENCMRCVNACSQRAIESSHAYAISLFFMSSFIISPALLFFLKKLNLREWIHQSFITESIWTLIYSASFLLLILISYKILQFCMRFKLFNQFIKYTSLSSYSFWRRYQAPKYQ